MNSSIRNVFFFFFPKTRWHYFLQIYFYYAWKILRGSFPFFKINVTNVRKIFYVPEIFLRMMCAVRVAVWVAAVLNPRPCSSKCCDNSSFWSWHKRNQMKTWEINRASSHNLRNHFFLFLSCFIVHNGPTVCQNLVINQRLVRKKKSWFQAFKGSWFWMWNWFFEN